MRDDPPEGIPQEFIEAIRKMSEKLVELGFATRTVRRDEHNLLHIQFTREGKVLQDHISRIFASVNQGERFDFYELQAFMAIMAMKQSGDVAD